MKRQHHWDDQDYYASRWAHEEEDYYAQVEAEARQKQNDTTSYASQLKSLNTFADEMRKIDTQLDEFYNIPANPEVKEALAVILVEDVSTKLKQALADLAISQQELENAKAAQEEFNKASLEAFVWESEASYFSSYTNSPF